MAQIVTDEDFRMACNWLIDHDQLPVTGEREVNAAERKVYDQTAPGIENRVDITPSQAVLEAALDDALAAVADETAVNNARQIALRKARKYILNQLRNPQSVATIYNTVRDEVEEDPELPGMINSLNLLANNGGIPNWTLDLTAIDTDPERRKYLWLVVWLFPVLEV